MHRSKLLKSFSIALLLLSLGGVCSAQDVVGCLEKGIQPEASVLAQYPPRKVMILGASFGGGHESSGKAIRAKIMQLDPNAKIEYKDMMDFSKAVITKLAKDLYWKLAKVSPGIYDFLYRHGVKKEKFGGTFFKLDE